ncbi:MAG: hypothetical protein KDC57_13795 [Saprospiraceae bacterium]|nr:hypothetical protein [Saprospiraceae bacterium]
MKHSRWILLGSMMLMTTFILAQKNGPGDRIDSYRIAFFTENLQLTPEESQAFWPIYNRYRDATKELRTPLRKKEMALISDAEAEQMIEEWFDRDEKELGLKRQLYSDLKQVIPLRKAAMVFVVERDFNAKLLQVVRNRNN